MKKLILVSVIIMVALIGARAQEPVAAIIDSANMPVITFAKLVHDYGTVNLNGNGDCTFEFTNTGKEPLVLTNVRSSCGCTVPSWPREPILPGKTGVISVKYNTNRAGVINKTVTVNSNARNSTVTLRIIGSVVNPPSEMMPEKTVDQGSTPASK
jgi:hypothetical protein